MSHKQKNNGSSLLTGQGKREIDQGGQERGEMSWNFLIYSYPEVCLVWNDVYPCPLPPPCPTVADENDIVHSCPGLQFDPELKKANHLRWVSNKPIKSLITQLHFCSLTEANPKTFQPFSDNYPYLFAKTYTPRPVEQEH